MWTRDLHLAGRVERWKAGYMWTRHTHRHHHTTLLTCGNTCTNTTNENTGHRTEDSWRWHIFTQEYTASESYYIQLQMFAVKKKKNNPAYSNKCLGQKKPPEHCQPGGKQLLNHKRSFILECKRQKERGGKDRERFVIAPGCPFNVRLTHCLPKFCGIYVSLLTETCICACASAHVQYPCITTTFKQSANPTGHVTALKRCSVRTVQHCHQRELGGTETGYYFTWEQFAYHFL